MAGLRLMFGPREQLETIELRPRSSGGVTDVLLKPYRLLTQRDLDVLNDLSGVGPHSDSDNSDTECDES